MSDRVKSVGEVDSSKNCWRTRLGLVEPIRNELRKIKHLIKSRQSGRENGVRLQKEGVDAIEGGFQKALRHRR